MKALPYYLLRVGRPAIGTTAMIACLFLSQASVLAQNFWQPNTGLGPPYVWSNPAHWSAGVPGSGSNVFIGGSSPVLDVNAQIGSLTIEGSGGVRGQKNLIVTGTTTLQNTATHATSIHATTGGVFSLGTLANYSDGVLTGNYTCDDSNGPSAATVVQFRGANVTELQGEIYLFGAGSVMLDQDSGLNAFRNLAVNNGFFYLEDSPHSTSGNLINNDQFYIFDSYDAAGTSYTVNGSVTNNRNGDLELYGNAEVIVKGNLLNRGGGQFGNIYVYNDGDTFGGDCILSVDGDVVNEADSEITIEGHGDRRSRLIVKGSMMNDGELNLIGSGSMEVNGVLTVSSGSLTLNGDTGIETFQMTAARIDLAAGTSFGARGTIFADLVDHGVFRIGSSPGLLTVNGDVTLASTTVLEIEIGGPIAGTNFDRLNQATQTGGSGTVLDGTLVVSVINGYQVNNAETFAIITSDRPLNGAFDNVASGGRLDAVNGAGSFQVDYAGTNNVTLSDFEVAPLPVITSIPVNGVPNSLITILGTGFIGTFDVKFNGTSTFYFVVDSDNQITAFVPATATSGPITVLTNHGDAISSTSFIILADSDGDGMSDDFELQYFGSTTGGNPNDDSGDGDGKSNLDEFRAGTNPFDANSVLRVKQIRREGNNIVVVFPSVTDKRYRLEASTSPSGDFPLKLATVLAAAADPAREVTDVGGATEQKRFFRVVVLP